MARVSARVGWGRGSAAGVVVAAGNVALAAALFLYEHPGAACLVLGFAALASGFAFVHPHRVLETDDDDDPARRVGERSDD